jgi:hypothetical protein
LNVNEGGLGYQMVTQVTPAAYVASLVDIYDTLVAIIPNCLETNTKVSNKFYLGLQQIATSSDLETLDLQYLREVAAADFQLQHYLAKSMKIHNQNTLKSMIHDYYTNMNNTILAHRNIAWINSMSADEGMGSRWLSMSPKHSDSTFSPEQFKTSICYRLLLTIPTFIPGTTCTSHKVTLDPYGHHISTGCNVKAATIITHNAVKDVLCDMFNYAGLRTVKEEPHCFKALFPDNDMRPDLSIQNWPKLNPKSHKLILDIAICNPISFNGSLSLNQENNLGRLSDQRFRSKVSRCDYLPLQRR